jgi:hypothetical protein
MRRVRIRTSLASLALLGDRKSVVAGRGGTFVVHRGGGRNIKKKSAAYGKPEQQKPATEAPKS